MIKCKKVVASIILLFAVSIVIPASNLKFKNRVILDKVLNKTVAKNDDVKTASEIIAMLDKEEKERIQKEKEAKERARKQKELANKVALSPVIPTSELQAYAHDLVINTYGWTESDFTSLVNLWNRESGWNPNSHNSRSGAHGIPQALPASKMASEGADYYTNGQTQIRWGLKYISGRYGTPSNAWAHFQNKGWY